MTWTGAAGDGSVATAANWSPAQAPATGDTLLYAGATSLTPQLAAAGLSVGSITFNSTAAAFVLGGPGVYTVGITGITNNSASLETIANGIVLGGTQTWTANGALTVTGAINTSARALTIAGTANTALRGVISDTGSINKIGTGSLTIAGTNTLTGSTSATAGTIIIANNAAFGTGTLFLKSGTIQADASARTLANAVTLTANSTIGGTANLFFNGLFLQSAASRTLTVSNTATTTFAGGIQLTDAGTARTLTISTTGNVVISGTVSNGVAAGSLYKAGTGTLTITGANTHTGTTRVSAGILVLSNNAAAGTGTLSLNTGTLQAGISGLTLANNTTLTSSSTISGSRDITFNGTFTNSGNRTLTVTNTALTTMAGTVNLSNSSATRTWTVAGTGNVTISSTIQNGSTATSGNLIMSGTGTLTLTGASGNTYAGTTTVSAGTVVLSKSAGNAIPGTLNISAAAGTVRLMASDQIANTSAVTVTGTLNINGNRDTIGSLAGAGAVQLGAGGVLTVGARNTATTYSGVMSGAGSLVKNGTAALTLSGTNTFTGSTTVEGGSLILGKNGAIASTSPVTVAGSTSTLNLSTFTNTISSLTLVGGTTAGTGLMTLSGDVTATSSGGTAATMSGPVALSGARTFTVNAGGATSDLNITSILSSTGSLVKEGAGAMTISGVNTYTGSTTVNAGTLNLAGGSAIANTAAVIMADAAGATLAIGATGETIGTLSGGGTTGGNITIGGAALTITGNATNTYAGSISGAGGIAKGGTGVLTLSGTNTYAGATTVNAGTLRASGGSAISDASTVAMGTAAGTVLDLAGTNETIGALSGGTATSGGVTLGTGTLTVGSNNASTSYAGIISGTGGLTKTGTGTLTVTGAQTFSGVLAVQGGTLALSGAAGTAASATSISIGTGGTLALDNSGTENTARLASGVAINLKGGTLSFISDATGTSENFGALVPSSGASTISLTHNGTVTTASVMRFASLGTIGTGATVNFAATTGTLGAAATGPQIYITGLSDGFIGGWATVGSNFAEYSSYGVRALTGYYTGPLGINVNDPAQLVLLASTSPASAYTLTNIGTTRDSGLNLTDAPLVDLGADSSNVLNLVSGGLLKSTATNTTISGQGRLTSSGNVAGSLAITLNSTGSLTISSSIVNNAGVDGTYGNGDDGIVTLSKSGIGTLILSGTNTFSGNVVINSGILQASAEANLGVNSNDVTFNNGTLNLTAGFDASSNKVFKIGAGLSGTLDIASGQTLTLGNVADVLITADAAGTLFKKGAGAMVIQNANPTFDGKLQIDAGTVELRNAQSLGDVTNRGRIAMNGGTLNLRGDAATDFANAITVLSNSTVDVGRISGASPTVALTLGVLSIGANTLTITGSNATLGFGAVTLTGNATLDTTTADASVGSVSGAFSLTKTGTGILSISGTSTLTGGTNVSVGTLRFAAVNTRLANSALTVGSGATLDLNNFNGAIGSLTGAGSGTLGSGTLELGLDNTSTTFSGVMSGTGGLLKSGTGVFTLAAANTYSSATTVNGGALRLSASERIDNTSAMVLGSGGTLDLNDFDETVASLAGSGRVTLGSGTLAVASDTASTTFSGIASGTGGLTKRGTGTLILTGANSYTGATAITAGVLELQNAASLGDVAGGTTVASGGELRLNADLEIDAEALNLSGTGVSGSGALHSVRGTSSWAGDVTLSAASTIGVDAGTVTLTGTVNKGAHLLTFTGRGNSLVTGAISGTGSNGITKSGNGRLQLDAVSTYTGTTTVAEGVLNIQQAAALGAGGAGNGTTVVSGATLELTDEVGITVDTELLALNGEGLANRGALRNTEGDNIWNGAIALGSNATIGVDADSLTLGGALGDGGAAFSLTKTGAGSLILNGNASYTGATLINAGSIEIIAAERIHNGSAVTIAAGATLDLNDFNETIGSLAGAGSVASGDVVGGLLTMGGNNASTTYSGVITGLGSVVKAGTGTLTLTGNNLFTGSFTIQSGTVAINANAALGGGGSLVMADGTLRSLAALTLNRPVNLQSAGGSLDTNGFATSVSGVIDGPGALVKTGAGVLALSGANTYSGNTTISAGSIKICNSSAIPSGAGKGNVANAGTLDVNGYSITVNGLSGAGVVTNGLTTAATFTVGANDQSSVYGGTIQNGVGAIALTKTGTGTLTLNSANSYSGNTTIQSGTLQLGNAAALPSGAGKGNALVNGTLDVRGFSTAFNSLSGTGIVTNGLASAATLTVGGTNLSSAFSGLIQDGAGALAVVKTGTGTWTLGNANSYSGTTAVNGGVLVIGADASLGTAPLSALAGSLTLDGGTLSVLNSMTLQDTRGLAIGPVSGSGTGTLNIAAGANLRYAGIIANNGAGSGSLAIQGTGSVELAGANSYMGDTVLTGATLISGNTAAIPSGAGKGDFVDNGFLDLHGVGATVNGFSGSGRVTNTLAGSTASFNVGGNDRTSTFSGVIQDGAGSSALNKIGNGSFTLSGSNTYSGSTTVSAGQMSVTGSLTATSGVAVAANASFYLNGSVNSLSNSTVSGTFSGSGTLGNLAINNGGTLSPGSSSTAGVLNMGSLTFSSGSRLSMDIGSTVGGAGLDQIRATGPINLGGATLQLSLTNGYRPTSGSRYLLAYNGSSGGLDIGSFSGLTNNSTLTLTNDMGSFAFKIHYSDYDGNGSNDLFLSTADTKKQLSWAATGANASQGTLNPALIPATSAATGVRYTNVNEQGYDVVVITKTLNKAGAMTYDGSGAWWLEGGTASAGGKAIPYSTVTFRFFKTGTDIPMGLTGIQTTFQDAEVGERFRGFSYWNAGGTSVAGSLTDGQIFSYSGGSPIVHLGDSSVENGAVNQSGTQDGKWIGMDLSLNAISGFTFQVGRYNSSSGSVIMAALGADLVPTTEFLIKGGTITNVSTGPNFVAGDANALLTPAAITSALLANDVSVTSGLTQNISINENLTSSSGKTLRLTASTNLLTATGVALNLSSTTRSAGALNLTAGGSVRTGHLEATSTVGSGGAISATAGRSIAVVNGIDTSSNKAGAQGGAVNLQAIESITVDTIRTGGSASLSRLGAPGDITATAGSSIAVANLYANSGTGSAQRTTFTAPNITVGAAEIEGTMTLQKPASATAAAIAMNGNIQGTGSLVIDAGTGTASLNARSDLSGQTRVASGILAMNGKSLANSSVVMEGTSTLKPNITVAGESVAVKSLTMGANTSFGALVTSASTFDQVNVTNAANLAGTFKLTLASGYVPDLGTSFSIINYGSQTGVFSSYQGLRLADRVLVPVYTSTGLSLLTSTIASGASQALQVVPGGGLNLTTGSYYDGLTTDELTTGILRKATIIAGVASQNTALTMSLTVGSTGFEPSPDFNSTTLQLHGTGSDKFVLQLDYDEASVIAAGLDESQLSLGWSDTNGQFVNAVMGNTDLPGEANAPQRFAGAFDAATQFHLGYYGVDTVNNRMWAVLDHNSTYGFTQVETVPEPGTLVSLLGGLAILGLHRRRSSNRAPRQG